ncbi:MAG: hypothetical protein ACYCYF_08825 [Anaerolineae bacterium]
MPRFMVHHKLLKDVDESLAWWAQAKPAMAAANKAGQLPAKLLYTWNPDAHKSRDAFCLWEADSADLVKAAMQGGGVLEWMSAEILEVEETDWLA